MPRGPERPRTGPVETPEQERDRLLSETVRSMAREGMKDWQVRPEGKRNEGVKLMHSRMIGKLKTLQSTSTELVPHVEKALAPLVNSMEDPATAQRLDDIYAKIQAEVPDYGEEPQGNTYLSRYDITPLTKGKETVRPEDMLSGYYIANGNVLSKGDIRNDIDFLKTMLTPLSAKSAESSALAMLIIHLEQMRLSDPRNAVAEEMQRQKGGDTYMDIAGKEMGRTALTMFLLAGTVIFGTIGLVQFLRKGEISFAPFLWGIATYLMADKDLLKSFFGKDAQVMKQFEQLNTTTTSPVLKEIVGTYGIGGPQWSKTINSLYDSHKDDNLHGILEMTDPDEETIVDVINDISHETPLKPGETSIKPGEGPPANSIRGTLLRMIKTKDNRGKSDFAVFAKCLVGVEGADAHQFMVTYVRNNAFQAGPDLDPKTGAALKGAAAARSAIGNGR